MKKCNHFWEIVFPIEKHSSKQKFQCMYCEKIKKMEMPILDIGEFEKELKEGEI